MPDFANMRLSELVRPEGHPCACGRRHTCALKYLNIGRDILPEVPAMVAAMGKHRPFVVCDDNTWRAAGQRVDAILTDAGVAHTVYVVPPQGERVTPSEQAVGSIIMHFDQSCDMFLAVGSGVINDLCKVCAFATGRLTAVVGTAPSMDGYASDSGSMERDGVKVSMYVRGPEGILLDSACMAQAPMRMLQAGLGDMVAKYIAICEWRISHLVTGEYYCEDVAELMRASLRRIMAASGGIARRDPDAIASVAEGLVLAGIGMAFAGVSRPASGMEHYFSHMWEMMALERGELCDLHGIQVGVGTVLCMRIYRKLRQVVPDRARAEAHMRAFSADKWEAQVRRLFGRTAGQIIAMEKAQRKNDPARHAERLERIIGHWDDILAIIREELPDERQLTEAMAATGMPMTPAALGLSEDEVVDAFLGARDIRDKYLCGSLIWDLGLEDAFADELRGALRGGL